MFDTFVYKREVNKSVLCNGFGIDRKYLGFFTSRIGELKRGEKKQISIIFNGKSYPVIINNLNNPNDKRLNDAYQIRYNPNSEFVKALQVVFYSTYQYIQKQYEIIKKTGEQKRFSTNIPDEYKEYIAIYPSDIPDTFLCEPILSGEMLELKNDVNNLSELNFETELNCDLHDETAGIEVKLSMRKVRKYNRSICNALKKHYNYRCQICGKAVGEEYDAHISEVHHIDYFTKSLNNDISNLLVVCPNHHSIIHNRNPKFDRKECIYIYPNGYKEGLVLNNHLLSEE